MTIISFGFWNSSQNQACHTECNFGCTPECQANLEEPKQTFSQEGLLKHCPLSIKDPKGRQVWAIHGLKGGPQSGISSASFCYSIIYIKLAQISNFMSLGLQNIMPPEKTCFFANFFIFWKENIRNWIFSFRKIENLAKNHVFSGGMRFWMPRLIKFEICASFMYMIL